MRRGAEARRRAPAWRLASRLARREVRRRPGRTALVAVLVALPVAGMLVGAVLARTEHRTPEDWWSAQYGAADAAVSAPLDSDAGERLAGVPAGSRVVTFHTDFRLLKTAAGKRAATFILDAPVGDPIAEELVQVIEGRAPAAAGEVFLSRATAEQLGVGVGDTVRLTRPAELTVLVTGVGERRLSWGSDLAVFGPRTAIPWRSESGGLVHLIELPPSFDPAAASSPAGVVGGTDGEGRHLRFELAPRHRVAGLPGMGEVAGGDGPAARVAWTWVIGALVLVVFGIVIASAFAAGARRQLTTVGQLAANGAAPATVRLALLLQGTWTGLAGVAAGFVVGAAALAGMAPHLDDLLSRDVGPYRVAAVDLVPIVVLGVATASVAALVPARSLARVPVLAALAGRRPLAPVPRWLTPVGVGVCGLGLALLGLAVLGGRAATSAEEVWALTAIVGGLGVLLGACTVAPGYVSILGLAAARLGGGWRFAARSLLRQRTRTGAVVSAVCATGALAVGAAALVLGEEARFADDLPWMAPDQVHVAASTVPVTDAGTDRWTPPVPAAPPAELVATIDAVVPDARRRRLTMMMPAEPGSEWHVTSLAGDRGPSGGGTRRGMVDEGAMGDGRAVLADGPALEVYDLTEAQRADLGRTGALLLADVRGEATVGWAAPGAGAAVDGAVHPVPDVPADRQFAAAVHPATGSRPGGLPRLLVTSATAAELGLVEAPGAVVWTAAQPLSGEQRAQLAEISEDLHAERIDRGPAGLDVNLSWLQPLPEVRPALVEGLLSGVALLLSLLVIAASLALAAAENKDERDVLAVVGAAPRTLVATSGRKALMLTALGALLAVPVGLLPVAVFVGVDDTGLPFVVPWRTLALLLLAAPATAWLVATLCSALAGRLRPVRISTMAFD